MLMKSITVKLKDDKNIELLTGLLESINFVESVEVSEDEDALTDEEISMVEERWAGYKKNPKSAVPWNTVKGKIKKKYGLHG